MKTPDQIPLINWLAPAPVSGTPNTTWLTRAVGCVLFSPQAPSPAVAAGIRGWSGDGGDLVSQRGEEPNARSQDLFDRSEGARWSSAGEPLPEVRC